MSVAYNSTVSDILGRSGYPSYNLGNSVTDAIGMYGVTPVVQRSGAVQAAVTTTAVTSSTPFGFSTSAQATAVLTLLNELRAALVALGAIKGSA